MTKKRKPNKSRKSRKSRKLLEKLKQNHSKKRAQTISSITILQPQSCSKCGSTACVINNTGMFPGWCFKCLED